MSGVGRLFAAYRSVPVRWRLGGGSAALTFVILASIAVVTGLLTDRQLSSSFHAQTSGALGTLSGKLNAVYAPAQGQVVCNFDLLSYAESDAAQIRFFSRSGRLLCSQAYDSIGAPANVPRFRPPRRYHPPRSTFVQGGYFVT
ncbi:MAG: hypothetical protein KGL15_11095, partial [Acidobacteriota bacterium]|nr:hypothetical protein [Acidobacteriota bacterium]